MTNHIIWQSVYELSIKVAPACFKWPDIRLLCLLSKPHVPLVFFVYSLKTAEKDRYIHKLKNVHMACDEEVWHHVFVLVLFSWLFAWSD